MYETKGSTGDVGRRAKAAVAVTGALFVAVAASSLIPDTTQPVASLPPAPSLVAQPTRESPSIATSVPSRADPSAPESLEVGRQVMLIDGIRFSLEIPASWDGFGPDYPNYITRSEAGPQGAEGVIFWTRYPGGQTSFICSYLKNRSGAHSLVDLAAAASSVSGTDLIEGPIDVTLGGRTAKHVEFRLREDVGCDPGLFFTYANVYGGTLWPETVPGDTVRVWIVDLDGAMFWVQGSNHSDATENLIREMEQTIDSIRFD